MLSQLFLIFFFAIGLIRACDCVPLPAKQAKGAAAIVFRGTVAGFRGSPDGHREVIFRVSRVWKGKVKERFEMSGIQEGSGCLGFLPKLDVGNEMIVFAHKLKASDGEYFPIVCNTLLVRDVKDLPALGKGRAPLK